MNFAMSRKEAREAVEKLGEHIEALEEEINLYKIRRSPLPEVSPARLMSIPSSCRKAFLVGFEGGFRGWRSFNPYSQTRRANAWIEGRQLGEEAFFKTSIA